MNIQINKFTKNTFQFFLKTVDGWLSKDKNDRHINIEFKDETPFPENILPIAGIIDWLKCNGFIVNVRFYKDSKLHHCGLNLPYTVEKNSYELLSPMFKAWKYSSPEEVYKIVSSLVDNLNKTIICAKGVVEAFEWTINEIMDNVIQHSQSQFGYIMCTATNNSHISVAIYDNGIGILQSFRGSKYRLRTAFDAIQTAIRENTTRDPKIGQGNGMWGMTKIVNNNRGSLTIISSGARITINQNNDMEKQLLETYKIGNLRNPYFVGTLVDFQFLCNNEIALSDIFGENYAYTNLTLENLEDEKNRIHILISDFSLGCATRIAGANARTIVQNYMTQSDYKQVVVLDFKDVGIIASSFADEFIGKLIQ